MKDKQPCSRYYLCCKIYREHKYLLHGTLPPLPSYVLPSTITPSQYTTPHSAMAEPDARSHIPLPVASVSSRRDPIGVNLVYEFDRQDLDNLRDIGLQLPSRIYESDTISETRQKVKTLNKSLGQYLGIGAASKKISKESKARMESQRDTLKKNLKTASNKQNPPTNC